MKTSLLCGRMSMGKWATINCVGRSPTVLASGLPLMRKPSPIRQSYGVYGKPGSGCAADNLIVNYPVPVAPGLAACGGRNLTFR